MPYPSEDYNLAVKHPDVAKEWHPTKNGAITPQRVTPASHKWVWWLCSKSKEHEWEADISSRARNGRGCPYCSGRFASAEHNLAVKFPEVAKEWHPTKNGKLTPYQVTPGTHQKVWWLCSKSKEHEWESRISSRTGGGTGCRKCYHGSLSV